MDRQANIELIRYKDLREWHPCIGDLIIKQGWIIRTKWFGIITDVDQGALDVMTAGVMRLLVTASPVASRGKMIKIAEGDIKDAMAGTYTVLQHDQLTKVGVWYV